jgi:heme o synthase
MNTIRNYYQLAKPGIIYGNVITAIAAFIFATHAHIESLSTVELFLATIAGIALVIGSACVFNNYLDRKIDAKMARTQNRALVTGAIKARDALLFGAFLGIVGFALLYIYVNELTAGIAGIGFIFYVVIYGLVKRGSHWGALVGSVSGAVPIVVGYTGVTNQFDLTALVLFAILMVWQMPHFYAIAIYRREEYAAAGIPTLVAQKGILETKLHMLSYLLLYVIATSVLFLIHSAGYVYFAGTLISGIIWLGYDLKGFSIPVTNIEAENAWARKVFLGSLIALLVFCLILALSPLLP